MIVYLILNPKKMKEIRFYYPSNFKWMKSMILVSQSNGGKLIGFWRVKKVKYGFNE